MKLFAIVIGGEHPQAHIEVHDIRFVIAERIEATHDTLRAQWWGTPGTLHIDCWAQIDHIDGFDVSIALTKQRRTERLFYVNLGGYDPSHFSELHRNVFVVATSVREAKARAIGQHQGWRDLHRDDLYEAEQVVALNDAAEAAGAHIWLNRVAETRPLKFVCKYVPLR